MSIFVVLKISADISVDKLLAELEKARSYIDRQWEYRVQQVVDDLITDTPQWSGSLASSWEISVGESSHSLGVGSRPRFLLYPSRRGLDPSVREGKQLASMALIGVQYGVDITITNTQPYAEEVDQGIGPNGHNIREENLMEDGRVGMLSYIYSIYSLNWRN